MPFTGAHPAIILPFTRVKQLSVTALVVGSVTPDFEYFFQLKEVENIGHQWKGVVLFDLPFAFALSYIFHLLIRDLLILHLPVSLKEKCLRAFRFNWHQHVAHNFRAVLISLFVGITSHLVWDSFTHHDGLFVRLMPTLQQVVDFSIASLPMYTCLQIAFSILGLGAICVAILRSPSIHSEAKETGLYKFFWPILIGITSMILLGRLLIWPEYNTLGGIAIAIMGSGTYGLILVAIGHKIYSHKN